LRQETRFCTSPDGVGLAYAIDGEGAPLVKVGNWMTHLDYERQSPVWRHWVRELSRGRTLVRYDVRGCGLSDRQFEGPPTLDTYVDDLAAVVDAARLERFALFGDDMQQASSTGAMAARLWESSVDIDISDTVRLATQPALVLHARHDGGVPYEEGRRVASLLPDARLVTLESDNHILQEGEPAWEQFLSEVRAFLGDDEPAPAADGDLSELSSREREVLELVATGMTNEQIAARLFLSARTVERHLSNVYAKLRLSGKSARAAAAARFSRA
jgi:pimeloyl-ACP methyl ester carboxylesterase/DNA-binding CsgD family transcriptional regulator